MQNRRPGVGKAAVPCFVQIRGIGVWRLPSYPHRSLAGHAPDTRRCLTVDNFGGRTTRGRMQKAEGRMQKWRAKAHKATS